MALNIDLRDAICWACFWMDRGDTVCALLERNAKREPPIPEDLLKQAIPHAMQAMENVRLVNAADGDTPLCKIKGCKFQE